MTAISNPLPRTAAPLNKILLVSAGLGAAALAFYSWALINKMGNLLAILGLVVFLAMLLCPVIVAFITIRLTLREMKTSASIPPIQSFMMLSLRQCAFLIIINAVVFIPIMAIFMLYLSLLFGSFVTDGAFPALPDYNLYAVEGLLIGLGFWGLNLLASLLGVGLAIRLRHMLKAIAAVIVLLILTLYVMNTLQNRLGSSRLYFDAIAALLPYVLTAIGLLLLRKPKSEIVLEQ